MSCQPNTRFFQSKPCLSCRSAGVAVLFFAWVVLFSSCFKEDRPIVLPEAPGSSVETVFLGSEYQNQLFYNLSRLDYVQRDIRDWDLAFDCRTDSFKVVTNYGRDIFVARTQLHDLTSLTQSFNHRDFDWLYDFPSGVLDSNAFGNWKAEHGSSTPYYLIDMGRRLPQEERYYYVRVVEANPDSYTLHIGLLFENGSSDPTVLTWPRNPSQTYTYVNLRTQQVMTDFEPPKNDWDILFTRYRHIFYIEPNPELPFPYLVTGALLNPYNTQVAIDSVTPFHDIDLDFCTRQTYSTSPDAIGYAWKDFDFSVTFTYSINSLKTYIVKNQHGQYYKIRFLDFYNENRLRGYPKFEIKPVLY